MMPIKCNVKLYESMLWDPCLEDWNNRAWEESCVICGTVVVSKKQLVNAVVSSHYITTWCIINDGMFAKNKYTIVDGTSNDIIKALKDHHDEDVPEGDYRITCWYNRYDDSEGYWDDPVCQIDFIG